MAVGNIVLTGFMATGKSTVGQLLAERLGYEWVDTDSVIEARHGPIPEIFRNDGEESFRDLERMVARDLAKRERLVISTGGGMMLDDDNAAVLGENARVFCLTAEPDEIVRRSTSPTEVRPLLANASPAARIAELLDERRARYDRFEQVATDGLTADEVVAEIAGRI